MTIRWGMIGCGDVAEVKSGPGFQQAAGSVLVMAMRRNAAKAEDYALRHGVPRWTSDADQLIQDPEVDAVYIATPPGSHLDYALRVAAAGKPAYVEKPMARNHAECRRMIEAFSQAGLPLFVAFYRRRLPRFLKAKELVDSGRLGQVTMLNYRYADNPPPHIDPKQLEWRLAAEQAGGGIFLDMGCHALDIFDFILGPIESVQGRAANLASPYEVEDVVALDCRFAAGVLGVCGWNFASAACEDQIEITGTQGRLTLSVFGNEPLRLETGAGIEHVRASQSAAHPATADPEHRRPVARPGRMSEHGRRPPARRGSWTRCLASYYGGRDDAFWTRPETWPGRRG